MFWSRWLGSRLSAGTHTPPAAGYHGAAARSTTSRRRRSTCQSLSDRFKASRESHFAVDPVAVAPQAVLLLKGSLGPNVLA